MDGSGLKRRYSLARNRLNCIRLNCIILLPKLISAKELDQYYVRFRPVRDEIGKLMSPFTVDKEKDTSSLPSLGRKKIQLR